MFSFCCYPLILFSFVAEQYIIGLFYLILTIYVWYYKLIEINYLYIGAVGTLLTSDILFSFISRFKNIKNWFYNIFKCFIAFLIIMIITGQILEFYSAIIQFEKFISWSGEKILFIYKLYQFIYFVRSIFIAPKGNILIINKFPLYRLIEVNYIDIFGLIILLLCIVSYILNRKEKFVNISFLWLIFSFFILCLLGWGTAENGLILYSLYFSWAYIVLIFKLIDKVIKNKKYIINSIFCMYDYI